MEKERAELELQMKRLKHELNAAQLELNKAVNQYKEAQNQIQMLSTEKGTHLLHELWPMVLYTCY